MEALTNFLDVPEAQLQRFNKTKFANFLVNPSLVQKHLSVVSKVLTKHIQFLPNAPTIVPVWFPTTRLTLRGWAGLSEIYVNLHALVENPESSWEADVCTVGHEASHFYLRQLEDNWNFSTPTKLGTTFSSDY